MKLKLFLGLALGLCILYALKNYNIFPFHHERSRATSSVALCINNLRYIDAAINQWALDHGKHAGDAVKFDDLKPYFKNGEIPRCRDGGTYSVTVVGALPTCSLGINTNSLLKKLHVYIYGEEFPNKAPRYHRLP